MYMQAYENWQRSIDVEHTQKTENEITVKPVYNDHPMGYFSAFWSSSKWPRQGSV